MENTSSLLFDNADEKFFLAGKDKIVGPLTTHEVYQRIQSGKLSLMDFFWCSGWNDWKRICEYKEFAILIAKKPPSSWIKKIEQSVLKDDKADKDPKNYYLYFSRSQYGPFSKAELIQILETKNLNSNSYLWIPGWPNWKKISEHAEFGKYIQSAPPLPGKKAKKSSSTNATMGAALNTVAGVDSTDKRKAPRRPLVARLFLHNNEEVLIAVCRDISVGGMQVLTDRVPGPVGSIIRLNVSPSDTKKVSGFVAEGEIVRVLEDGRGFSFRFLRISSEAKQAIEKYINET